MISPSLPPFLFPPSSFSHAHTQNMPSCPDLLCQIHLYIKAFEDEFNSTYMYMCLPFLHSHPQVSCHVYVVSTMMSCKCKIIRLCEAAHARWGMVHNKAPSLEISGEQYSFVVLHGALLCVLLCGLECEKDLHCAYSNWCIIDQNSSSFHHTVPPLY